MKKLSILLLAVSAALATNNPFERLHESIQKQISDFNNAFESIFNSTTIRSNENDALKNVEIQETDDAVIVKIEFGKEPKGSIEASKKNLVGTFECDGYKVEVKVNKDDAYRYIDGSNWIITINSEKKSHTEAKKSADGKEEAATYSYSSQSKTRTIQAHLGDLKKFELKQDNNSVELYLPKNSDKVRTVALETKKVELAKAEVATEHVSESKEEELKSAEVTEEAHAVDIATAKKTDEEDKELA